MTHRFFTDHTYTGNPGLFELPPPPWNDSLLAEFRYPYDVLEVALPNVRAEGLTFIVTKEAYFLPKYGPDVVVILLQEERCKVPVYGRHVRAVIRNLTEEPYIGFRPHLHFSSVEPVCTFEYLRNQYTNALSRFHQAFPPANFPAPIREEPVVTHLPLGYHRQVELPQVAMKDRTLDTFFAGQVHHEVDKGSYIRYTSTSKFESRAQLWRELEKLQKTGVWNLDLGNIAAGDTAHASYNSFSEKMMQSRICVSPRGTMAECYRTYEGLRAGCLVVCNPQQPDEFLGPEEAPLMIIDHWREFEGILKRYARDYDTLEEWRAKSLAWWNNHLRPELFAKRVIRDLNDAGDTLRI